MRVGIDLDNTIIRYDDVFLSTAVAMELLPPGSRGTKAEVRAELRRRDEGEEQWQRLQGAVYGRELPGACLFEGVDSFLRRCRREGVPVWIVSHKTRFGHFDPDRVDLQEAALSWMSERSFFDKEAGYGIPRDQVFLESDRARKIRRIASLDLSYFIDDLPEVLTDAAFPSGPIRILFCAGPGGDGTGAGTGSTKSPAGLAGCIACESWADIEEAVFGDRS